MDRSSSRVVFLDVRKTSKMKMPLGQYNRAGSTKSLDVTMAKANIDYLKENGYHVEHKVADLRSVMDLFHSSLTTEGYEVPEGHYAEAQMKQTVVPNRNAIFSSVLYGYALSVALRESTDVGIALGVHSGDHAIYPDCRPEFYEALEHAFAVGNWDSERVWFHLPHLAGDKVSILEDSLQAVEQLGLDFDTVFANTNTSYQPDEQGRASGKTGADVERVLAFHAIGRQDPVAYVDPWPKVVAYALQTEKEFMESEAK